MIPQFDTKPQIFLLHLRSLRWRIFTVLFLVGGTTCFFTRYILHLFPGEKTGPRGHVPCGYKSCIRPRGCKLRGHGSYQEKKISTLVFNPQLLRLMKFYPLQELHSPLGKFCSFQQPIPKKNMCMGPYTAELTVTSLYVHSRVDSNTFTVGNPSPESTFTLCQRLWIQPQGCIFPFLLLLIHFIFPTRNCIRHGGVALYIQPLHSPSLCQWVIFSIQALYCPSIACCGEPHLCGQLPKQRTSKPV